MRWPGRAFQTMTSWKGIGSARRGISRTAIHRHRKYKAAHVISSQGNELWIECAFSADSAACRSSVSLIALCVDKAQSAKKPVLILQRFIGTFKKSSTHCLRWLDIGMRLTECLRQPELQEWFGWTQQEMKGLTFQEVLGEYYQTVESRVEAAA